MENQNENQEHKTLQTKPEDSWPNSDKVNLVQAATVYFSDLDDFGKGVDIKLILQKYALFFEGGYSVDQIIQALHTHCLKSTVIPKVSHLEAILSPEPVRISQTEFIHAKDQWAKEGYPKYSYYAGIVRDYERENHEERAKDKPIEDNRVLNIINSSIKRINQKTA